MAKHIRQLKQPAYRSAMMPENDYIDVNTILKSFVGPWYESLENPAKAQETVLLDLLKKYGATDYGSKPQRPKNQQHR